MDNQRPHTILFLINFPQLTEVQKHCIGNIRPQTHPWYRTSCLQVAEVRSTENRPFLCLLCLLHGTLRERMVLTPAAAGANVYDECITMAHRDAVVQPVYMCTNQKKRVFHVTGPIKKIVTWEKRGENAKIKRTITDSQNHVENIAIFPAAENCCSQCHTRHIISSRSPSETPAPRCQQWTECQVKAKFSFTTEYGVRRSYWSNNNNNNNVTFRAATGYF